jgi:hypothetical protein
MSIVQVQIPDSLHKSLSDLAGRDGISIDSVYIHSDRGKALSFNDRKLPQG